MDARAVGREGKQERAFLMSFERQRPLAGRGVPKPDRLVRRRRRDLPAVRREHREVDGYEMAAECGDVGAAACIPDLRRGVARRGDQPRSVTGKGHRFDETFMALQDMDRRAVGGVPEPGAVVLASGGDQPSVGRIRRAEQRAGMPFERGDQFAVGDVPQSCRVVPCRGDHGPAIGREGRRYHVVRMSFEPHARRPAGNVPDLRRPFAAGCHEPPIRRERHAVHGGLRRHGADRRSGGPVPQHHGRVAVARCDDRIVGRECDGGGGRSFLQQHRAQPVLLPQGVERFHRLTDERPGRNFCVDVIRQRVQRQRQCGLVSSLRDEAGGGGGDVARLVDLGLPQLGRLFARFGLGQRRRLVGAPAFDLRFRLAFERKPLLLARLLLVRLRDGPLPLRLRCLIPCFQPEPHRRRAKTGRDDRRRDRTDDRHTLAPALRAAAGDDQFEYLGGRRRGAARRPQRPVLGVGELPSAQQARRVPPCPNPFAGILAEAGRGLQPGPVGVESLDEIGLVPGRFVDTLGRKQVDFPQSLGQGVGWHRPHQHRHHPLRQSADFAELPVAPFRPDRVGRHQPHHGVAGRDEMTELGLPLLAIGQVAPVDDHLEAVAFERHHHRVGGRHVGARVGQEDLQPIVRSPIRGEIDRPSVIPGLSDLRHARSSALHAQDRGRRLRRQSHGRLPCPVRFHRPAPRSPRPSIRNSSPAWCPSSRTPRPARKNRPRAGPSNPVRISRSRLPPPRAAPARR